MIARDGRPFISALLFLLLTMSLPASSALGEEAKFGHYLDEGNHPLWHLTRLSHRQREDSESAATYDYMTGGAFSAELLASVLRACYKINQPGSFFSRSFMA